MKKIETIWHHILHTAVDAGVYKHTQQGLAREFGYSLSTVNHALEVPTNMGAIRKESKFFVLQDAKKLLYYWASVREISKDVYYSTFFDAPVREREGMAPADSMFAAYSAARIILGEAPADYEKIYFYVAPDSLSAFQERYIPVLDREPNVFALRLPSSMARYGNHATLIQTFVDIWNLPDWYSRDFIQALEQKAHGILS